MNWLIDTIEDILSDKGEVSQTELQRGDIVGVDRILYQHYAVYVGENAVIHYAGANGYFDDDICVREASFQDFLDGATEYFICQFSKRHKAPKKRYNQPFSCIPIGNDLLDIFKTLEYHLFTPEETVERAYSRLGEREYDLVNNNCEHFAIWCKTNGVESWQVKTLLENYKGFPKYVV